MVEEATPAPDFELRSDESGVKVERARASLERIAGGVSRSSKLGTLPRALLGS